MNKIMLIGNLTKDPETQQTPSGVTVCKFSIAVRRKFKNQAGEYEADFINIVAWRKLAELCGQYLDKGKKVAIVGSMQNNNYNNKEGKKVYRDVIVADEVEFLTPKGTNTQPQQQNTAQGNYNNQGNKQNNQNNDFEDLNDNDEIIPF